MDRTLDDLLRLAAGMVTFRGVSVDGMSYAEFSFYRKDGVRFHAQDVSANGALRKAVLAAEGFIDGENG